MKVSQIIGLTALLFILGQSCATSQKTNVTRPSSKVVYSLMTKDSVGLESVFSDDLKKSLKGEMLLKAFSSVEKQKGDMQAIEFNQTNGDSDLYSIRMKKGKVPLKLKFNSSNQLENVWINDVAMKREN